MTTEEKDLLFQDISARLPYGVKVQIFSMEYPNGNDEVLTTRLLDGFSYRLEEIKPYLRPMSSMTEEEENEVNKLLGYRKNINGYGGILCSGWNGDVIVNIDVIVSYLNWLNAHHFDYRDLIEEGLALEAPEGMYKIE